MRGRLTTNTRDIRERCVYAVVEASAQPCLPTKILGGDVLTAWRCGWRVRRESACDRILDRYNHRASIAGGTAWTVGASFSEPRRQPSTHPGCLHGAPPRPSSSDPSMEASAVINSHRHSFWT